MTFDFFRAYAATEAVKMALAVDEYGDALLDDDGRCYKVPVEQWPVEDVVIEGPADEGGASASFDAGETVITRVVFFQRADHGDVVVGTAEVGRSGEISVSPPERRRA